MLLTGSKALHRQITNIGRRFDFTPPVSTPPLTFLAQLAQQQPQLADEIKTLTGYYQQCLYQELSEEQYAKVLAKIKAQVKQLKRLAPKRFSRLALGW